jgi:imidazolonepropionase
MKTLFINIKELLQIRDQSIQKVSGSEMGVLPSIKNAFLIIENNLISDFGEMQTFDFTKFNEVIDVSGKIILPTWCDSHTHLVYAGNREQEFVDRINGLTYEEIANRGGGILNSAKKLQETSEEDLFNLSKIRLEEIMQLGTGAVEIKSGYGLDLESELKILRVIKKLKQNYDIEIKATFLGAHAFPLEFKDNRNGYINLIINEMIPKIAQENLADFIDVFCETGYFSAIETDMVLKAGIQFGMIPKIHVNQFNSIGGIEIGVKNKALSVDHLEVMNEKDFEILKNSQTMPVALPLCSFFLGIPYTQARKLISEGLAMAVASDFNPGSTPSGNMNFVVATSCIKLKITPEEAINAATINGAFAMGISASHGSICIGKRANFIITKPINSFYELPYSFGSNLIYKVYIEGKMI